MASNLDKWIDSVASVTPDTSIYAAGDSIGGALTFSITGSSTGGGLINSLLVTDNDNEGAAGALWLFKQDLATPIADQAAFAPIFADLSNLVGIYTLPAFVTVNSLKVAILNDINDKFQTTTNQLIGYFVPSGTPTYAAAKTLRFQLGILTQ